MIDASGQNNSASVTIAVGKSTLVALIDGGDRTVGATSALVLDATESYDPDTEELTGANAGLSFTWSCTR